MALLAALPGELQAMIDIVYGYACKWGYVINSSQSHIIILSQKPSLPSYEWYTWVIIKFMLSPLLNT